MKVRFTFFIFFLGVFQGLAQSNALEEQIKTYLQSKSTLTGVAIKSSKYNETILVNADTHLPTQSVYKMHLAIYILSRVEAGEFSLDQEVLIKPEDLLKDIWSPLRDQYPDGNVKIKLSEILSYTVSQSDNSGCDILFRMAGGPSKVNQYFKKLGIKDLSIQTTEEVMQSKWEMQFKNWSTPQSTLNLLESLHTGKILKKDTYDFLWRLMVETSTGANRLKKGLPEGTVIAHKTGTSGSKEGITAATNDVGIILLPDQSPLYIAVYVSDSKEDGKTTEAILADIAKMSWEYFTKK